MNIISRLKNNALTGDELSKFLDSSNPIILYETISYIVRNHVIDKVIIDKLILLSELLDDKHKMLGYYKLGHVAMGALLKLGFDERIVFKSDLDNFEKEMAIKFSINTWQA